MVSFENDYVAGAHPRILQRLLETNMEPLPGYGTDLYCERAREKIRAACGCPEAGVEFFTGGTQANAVIISSMLNDYEGVIAASTGHISVHEAGAIEFTGHKVLEIPHREGKIEPARLKAYLEDFYADKNHTHMVFPGMVYISHPTEYGTIYTKNELEELSGICRSFGIPLYLDGARLGYGLMSRQSDLELADIARYCDVFYIGGRRTVRGSCRVLRARETGTFSDIGKKTGRTVRKGTAVRNPVRYAVYRQSVFRAGQTRH